MCGHMNVKSLRNFNAAPKKFMFSSFFLFSISRHMMALSRYEGAFVKQSVAYLNRWLSCLEEFRCW
jgi:hypothetical protein